MDKKTFQTVYYGFKGNGEIDKGQYNFIKEVPAVAGVMMFIRRELIETIGLFDKNSHQDVMIWIMDLEQEKQDSK